MYLGITCHYIFILSMESFIAQISIKDLGVLDGYLPPKALALVIEWSSIHQQELIDDWVSLSENGNGTCAKI